ncbi:MAG: hypothetical protein C4523_16850 [Myxococcales bacterium]|nr:MAG: hypothetical protein C4523_16850 [Myxococcales bacterium]
MTMKKIALFAAFALAAAVLVMGCEKSYKKANPDEVAKAEKAAQVQKTAEELKAKQEAEAAKAGPPIEQHSPATDPDCWGKADPQAPPKTFAVGAWNVEITENYKLRVVNADPAKPLTLGAVTDIKTAIEANLKNLAYFIDEFKKAGVSAIVISGDLAEKLDEYKTVLDVFGQSGILTLFIIGNRDKKEDFTAAANELGAKYPNLINMNRIRLADLGAATIVSLPGYYDPNYIHNPPGCPYNPIHLGDVKKLVEGAKNPVVLVSHGPPRGMGKDAIDQAVEAGNVGDPKMAWLIGEAKIPFGIFGNIHEAGGKAVGADMQNVVKPDVPSDKLYLNPGPADSDPWNMNDGSRSKGMAGLFKLEGGKASYKILRVK